MEIDMTYWQLAEADGNVGPVLPPVCIENASD